MFNNREFLTFKNMLTALRKCCRNVRWKTSVTQYEMNGLKNTVKLIESVKSGEYELSEYQQFKIFEPKERNILATRIKDRQIQRSLCDNYLYHEITRHFIYDNCACQIGKGTNFAINRMKTHLQKYYRHEKSNCGYYLKCDIHHFFESINHDKLKSLLESKVRNKECRSMIFEIIDSFGDVGLGLGSQVSQLLALLYLDPLDHYIKETLMIKHYIRYMDDFILIHNDRRYLSECLRKITLWLKHYDLELNSKTCLQPLKKSITFLNFKFAITDSGKVITTSCKKRSAFRMRKLKAIIRLFEDKQLSKQDVYNTANGMIAHLKRYNTYRERDNIIRIVRLCLNNKGGKE